jgi:methyl-accepting chemotaxis protein
MAPSFGSGLFVYNRLFKEKHFLRRFTMAAPHIKRRRRIALKTQQRIQAAKEALQVAADKTQEVIEEVVEQVVETTQEVAEEIVEAAEEVKETAEDIIEETVEAVQEVKKKKTARKKSRKSKK